MCDFYPHYYTQTSRVCVTSVFLVAKFSGEFSFHILHNSAAVDTLISPFFLVNFYPWLPGHYILCFSFISLVILSQVPLLILLIFRPLNVVFPSVLGCLLDLHSLHLMQSCGFNEQANQGLPYLHHPIRPLLLIWKWYFWLLNYFLLRFLIDISNLIHLKQNSWSPLYKLCSPLCRW